MRHYRVCTEKADDILGVSGCIFKSVFLQLVPMTGKTTEPCYMFPLRWEKNHYRYVNTKPAESRLNMKKLSVSTFFSFIIFRISYFRIFEKIPKDPIWVLKGGENCFMKKKSKISCHTISFKGLKFATNSSMEICWWIKYDRRQGIFNYVRHFSILTSTLTYCSHHLLTTRET